MDWKVFNPNGKQVASCRYASDAAAIIACYGDGATLRYNGRIVYKDGRDGNAADSFDAVAEHADNKAREHNRQSWAKNCPGRPYPEVYDRIDASRFGS